MKIAFVSDVGTGTGAAIAARRLTDRIHSGGDQVLYIHLYGAEVSGRNYDEYSLDKHRGSIAGTISKLVVRAAEQLTKGRRSSGAGRLLMHQYYRRNLSRLTAVLEEFGADVVHLHNLPLLLGHAQVAELATRVGTVWTMHDCHAAQMFAYRYQTIDGATRTEPNVLYSAVKSSPADVLQSCDPILVGPSKWLAEIARREIPKAHIEIIPYGVDAKDFHPGQRPASAEFLNILVPAASLSSVRKNLELVSRAAPLTKRPTRVICLGEASRELRARHPDWTFAGRVDSRPELRALYSAADVTIVPSLADNLPNTVLESMFCGTPVVGSNVGGIPDMVRPGVSGWLVDPRNPQALAQLLDEIQHSRAGLDALRQTTLDFARTNFSLDAEAAAYRRIYAEAHDDHLRHHPRSR